jgi:hypothetical protein
VNKYRYFLSTLAAFALALPGHVQAEQAQTHGPGYDFIELGWSWLKAGHAGDGPAFNASKSLGDHAFIYGGASFIDFSHGHADAWRLGAGFHVPLNSSWDFTGRAAGQHLDEDAHSSYGVQAEVGFKGKFTPHLEAWLYAGRSQWSDVHFHDQNFVRIGGLYEFNHHWGLTADAILGPEEDEYFLGASYLF